MRLSSILFLALLLSGVAGPAGGADDGGGLIGHWKLARDARDSSGMGNHGTNHGVDFTTPGRDGKGNGAARFDGRKAFVEVPASPSLRLGRDDLTFALWIHTAEELDDVPGDLLAKYDPVSRRGVNLTLKSSAGMTNSQADFRHLHFGIDNGKMENRWTDCGRPGKALYVMAQATYDGQLYVGTCEPGKDDAGHVYRYGSGDRWIDCGSPDRTNAVATLAVYRGKLYAGTGRYRTAGSALPDSPNMHAEARIYRYEGDRHWVDCGRLPQAELASGLTVFRGRLYATSLYKPAGFFRYEGGKEWAACGLPKGGQRIVALGVFNGCLYGGSYDSCAVFRFDGKEWADLGTLEQSGQTYSFEILDGRLHVGSWPNGKVYRLGDGDRWEDVGRLGSEKEVMGMTVYNGKLYAGTLPLAEVYRFDGGKTWSSTGRLDLTPDVRYRRAWTLSVFQGRLFCGTLPSGHVYSIEAGKNATYDADLGTGWKHVAAVRAGNRLHLFVDGKQVARSSVFDPADYDLAGDRPLRIGFGSHDYFCGSMSDVRMYKRTLTGAEIAHLAGKGE